MSEESKLTLYHLTSSNKLDSILEQGLLPFNGDHCKKIKDRSSDIVFLCKKTDIKFWTNCFEDVDIVIEIDCTSIRKNLRQRYQRNAPDSKEYGCISSIPSDCFSQVFTLKRNESTLKYAGVELRLGSADLLQMKSEIVLSVT